MAYPADGFYGAADQQKASQLKASYAPIPQTYAPNLVGGGKDIEPGLTSEINQVEGLSQTLVDLSNTLRSRIDPDFPPIGNNSLCAPAPPSHIRFQLSNAIGNINVSIEQIRKTLDLISN